jgi:hypothetical protein
MHKDHETGYPDQKAAIDDFFKNGSEFLDK